MLGIYDDPDRDPRGHAVSVVYVCTAKGIPVAADDAEDWAVIDPAQVKTLCFDHNQIIKDYLFFKQREEFIADMEYKRLKDKS
jgi:8-oxo-dGTP diphosphatase